MSDLLDGDLSAGDFRLRDNRQSTVHAIVRGLNLLLGHSADAAVALLIQ